MEDQTCTTDLPHDPLSIEVRHMGNKTNDRILPDDQNAKEISTPLLKSKQQFNESLEVDNSENMPKKHNNSKPNDLDDRDMNKDIIDLAEYPKRNQDLLKIVNIESSPFLKSNEDEIIDEIDALPANLRYSNFDLTYTLISVLTYLFDLVMDCAVAYYFYHLAAEHGIYHYWYFGLTVSFVLIPSLTMNGFSLRWYLMDGDNEHLPRVPLWRWILRLLALIFQLAPVLRYADSIRYGLLSRKAGKEEIKYTNDHIARKNARERRIKYYTLMVYEDADATLLRLFECFMESAPQLVLQIYILIRDPQAAKISAIKEAGSSFSSESEEETNEVLKYSLLVVSVVSSLVSLAWSLVVYHRSLRYTYPNKKNLDCLGSIFQFLWHFSSITARVIALSLFASVYQQWIGVVCLIHWVFMSSWIIFQRTQACNTKCEEILFAFVLGAIYIFSFFNAKDEPTRYKYVFYYTVCFIENTILIALWTLNWQGYLTYGIELSKDSWYFYPGIVGHYLAFLAGVFFMIIYYYFFHPSGNINKTLLPHPIREQKIKIDSKTSSNRGRPNIGPISLELCNKGQNMKNDNAHKNGNEATKENQEIDLERPYELSVHVDDELSNAKRLSGTPSLSSPVLDRVDSTNENIANPENLQPLNRSMSEPAVTPPLTLLSEDLYISTHRRLKAMHGKERFKSGDRP